MKIKLILFCIGFSLVNSTIAFIYGQEDIIISEFMASNNSQLQDEDGDYSDWIELFNTTDSAINLPGWSLTDNEDQPLKWIIPNVTIEAHEYLVIFASGKDRKLDKDKLHANFKLSGSGEFLALVKPGGIQYATVFDPTYPEQFEDISYGVFRSENMYFTEPTPGAVNIKSPYVPPPDFSVGHGHFFDSFSLEFSSELDSVYIYFTIDASTPSTTNGIKYSEPINIDTTTVVRAVAVRNGSSSVTKTQSYFFPEDVIHQPFYPSGYPVQWLQPVDGTDDHIPIASDYGMHARVIDHSTVSPIITESLLDLPVVSIVSDIDNFFSESTHPDTGGIYMYTGAPDGPTRNLQYHLGRGWVRPTSLEYFNSQNGSIDFQVNCCIELHGGASRTPWKTAKHSFKLGFKSEYGPSKLKENIFGEGTPEQFDWLILRGGFALRYGLQIYDPWAKSTMRAMGQYAAYSQFVHVYLNGQYWGIYNLCERMDDNCLSEHFGGNAEQYDIIKDYYEVEAGDTVAWYNLVTMVQDNIADTGNYQKLLGNNPDGTPNGSYEKMVDVENLIDYMLMNFYAGNSDWDFHNWLAARRRVDSEGFKFFPWDSEYILQSAYDNNTGVNIANRPSGIFQNLMENNQFRDLFISRVNRHFFEGGALTPQPGFDRYKMWREIIDTAIVSESARWNSESEPKGDIWERGYNTFINSYFPVRTEIVFNQLVSRGMYPYIEPPVFNAESGYIPEDFQLFITAPSGGDIIYTFDGSDPGFADVVPSESVFIYDNNALPFLTDTINVKARVKSSDLWSKLVSKRFIIEGGISDIIPNLSVVEDPYLRIFPNPARNNVTIQYSLNQSSSICLNIYNLTGEHIVTLDYGIKQAGDYNVQWNANHMPSGNYFCILENMSEVNRSRVRIVIE